MIKAAENYHSLIAPYISILECGVEWTPSRLKGAIAQLRHRLKFAPDSPMLVIVDYLQLMQSGEERLDNSAHETLRVSRIATDLGVGELGYEKTYNIPKYGHQRGKQRFKCNLCKRQFLEVLAPLGYKETIKEQCLKMYLNGIGFRGIQRVMGVHHTTIIKWVKELGKKAQTECNEDGEQEIHEITQLDELQTFVGKKTKYGFGPPQINIRPEF